MRVVVQRLSAYIHTHTFRRYIFFINKTPRPIALNVTDKKKQNRQTTDICMDHTNWKMEPNLELTRKAGTPTTESDGYTDILNYIFIQTPINQH